MGKTYTIFDQRDIDSHNHVPRFFPSPTYYAPKKYEENEAKKNYDFYGRTFEHSNRFVGRERIPLHSGGVVS